MRILDGLETLWAQWPLDWIVFGSHEDQTARTGVLVGRSIARYEALVCRPRKGHKAVSGSLTGLETDWVMASPGCLSLVSIHDAESRRRLYLK